MESNLKAALQAMVDRIAESVRPDQIVPAFLAGAGLLDAKNFRQRATEALDYLATDPAMVQINIDEAVELIETSRVESSDAGEDD